MSDETKLLPCPFCGGIASYYASRENVFSARWTGHVVHCLECQARVQTVGGKDDAFTYWNRRAAPSQGDAQNGGLRRLLKEARQYVSDAGGDWDMETRANSQNLLEEIDRALTQPSAQSKDAAQ